MVRSTSPLAEISRPRRSQEPDLGVGLQEGHLAGESLGEADVVTVHPRDQRARATRSP
jgi:hypothetical protein